MEHGSYYLVSIGDFVTIGQYDATWLDGAFWVIGSDEPVRLKDAKVLGEINPTETR